MKTPLSKVLKITIPLGIGFFLVWYSLSNFTADDFNTLWHQIINANPIWLSISLIITLLCHVSRAIRWHFLIEPLGYKPRLKTSFSAIMIGYVSNLGIPRSGDILKAVTLSKYDNIPTQKVIGTVITERLIDLVMLLFILAIAFLGNSNLLVNYLKEQQIQPLNILLIIIGGILLLIIGFQFLKRIKFSFLDKIKKLITELYEGVTSIFKMQHKIAFILHTFFIWFGYIIVVYVLKHCLLATSTLSFANMLMVFVAGAFAFSTTNGGVGSYPITIGLVLMLFNINKTDGEALGWIIWGSQTITNLIVGGLAFLYVTFFLEKK